MSTTMIRFASPENTTREAKRYTTTPALRSSATTFNTPIHTRIEKRRKRTRTFAEDPFRSRFGQRLPKPMREEARGMEWKTFRRAYSPQDIQIEHMRTERKSAGRRHYEISIRGLRADQQGTRVSITAMGASSAMSEILADHGMGVEILNFHQYEIFEATATFIFATNNGRKTWAVGFGADRDTSIANALCAAASLLHRK